MKVLVFGSSGFFGRNISKILSERHDVYGATRNTEETPHTFFVDMGKTESIARVLKLVQPEVVINCAGVVENNEKAKLNPIMTNNLLTEIVACGIKPAHIVISGSAAEYGIVDKLPVAEDAPLHATSSYGLSKIEETQKALEFREKYQLPITIARIFNPIGADMPPRLLIPQLVKQVREIQSGTRESLEVSRLDAIRDYLSIKDACLAVQQIIEGHPNEAVYNIGSGKITSTKELIEIIIKNSNIQDMPKVVEAAAEPEPLFASQADITRIQSELGWQLLYTFEETVKEIMHATEQ